MDESKAKWDTGFWASAGVDFLVFLGLIRLTRGETELASLRNGFQRAGCLRTERHG